MKLIWLLIIFAFAPVVVRAANTLQSKTQASSPALDDWLYLQGATNDVRKLSPLYYLAASNNLSDVSSASAALSNLGAIFGSRVAKTATYTVVAGDKGKFIDCTSNTFSLNLTAAATLTSGFNFAVFNSGSGTVTIDPNGSETIRDATSSATTKTLAQGEGGIVVCDGTGFLFLKVTTGGTGSSAPTVVSPAYAATLSTDASQAASGGFLIVQVGTLTGDITLSNPTSPTNRQRIEWIFTQDGTGNRALTLGSQFRIPTSSTLASPINSTNNTDFSAAGKRSKLVAEYDSTDTKWDVVAFVPGY